jgi:hypothetical protein
MMSVIAFASGCAGVPTTGYVAQPGSICAAGNQFEDGARATATLDLEGRQLKAEWQWRLWLGALPLKWSAVSTVEGSTPPSQEDAFALLDWRTPPFLAKSKVRLELTTNPHRKYWSGSGFVTGYSPGGEGRTLTLAWPDLIALSRGAEALHVALRRPDGTLAYEASVDPKTFVTAANEVDAILVDLTEATKDFRKRCQRVDDVDPHFVVT